MIGRGMFLIAVVAAMGCAAAGDDAALVAKSSEPETFQHCPQCPRMVMVPGGTFAMGDHSGSGDASEKPVHEVTISRFALGQHEVTFAEYDACVAAGACSHHPIDERMGRNTEPVMNVRIADVDEYLAWLSKVSGKTYRLPSEAEWEYAARAGTTTRYWWGDVPSTDHANFHAYQPYYGAERGVYRRRTLPAGSLPANAFGLHHMHGNVFEWVADCWHPSYEDAPRDGSAWLEGGNCERRVARGGAWTHLAPSLRSAYRGHYPVRVRSASIGFRVARDLDQDEAKKAAD